MKRQLPLAFALASAAALASMVAFSNLSASVTSTGLRVNFTESGLQAGSSVSYRASADVSSTFVCVNHGGNTPSAANKRTNWSGSVSGTATRTASQSGVASGSVNLTVPVPIGFSCPKGQEARLSSAAFTDVKITDATHNTSADVGGTFKKTLIPIK